MNPSTPRRKSALVLAMALGFVLPARAQAPVGTAFTYQGRLTDAGLPASGTYDFEFKLFGAATGGTQVGAAVTRTSVAVSAGLFTTSLDFGASAFSGNQRWLEIAVKAPAAGAYTTLASRQELTPTSNALWAAKTGEAAAVGGGSLFAAASGGSVGVNTTSPAGASLVIQTLASEPAIVVTGMVGIGTATPLDMLHVAGDVRVGLGTTGCVRDADATVIAGTCSSDARLKTNIEAFAPVLERVAQLQPVEFDWRAAAFPERGFGARRSFGLIAQDVEKLFPELVATDAQGYRAVNYSRLPLVLLQALKESQVLLDEERAETGQLEGERARKRGLEERLAELERTLAAVSR